MTLKDLTNKLLKGDFTGLLGLSRDKNNVHPAEIAKVLTSIPFEATFQTFQSFPVKNQVRIFPYLDR